MENGRVSSMAQLSTWTDTMKSSKQPSVGLKSSPAADEDEYEEEFEDYEEEFEEETPVIAPSKHSQIHVAANSRQTVINNDNFIDGNQKRIETEKKSSQSKPVSDQKLSISKSIADPRTVRIQRIMNSGVLNLQLEKHTLYNALPTDPYDFYIQALRSPSSTVRQVGVPMDVELCDTEINTDEISVLDKAIQHCYEDDGPFFSLLENYRKNKNSVRESISLAKENTKTFHISSDQQMEEIDSFKVNKLTNFLQRAVSVFETVFRTGSSKDGNIETSSKVRSLEDKLFSNEIKWITLGKDYKHGSNELLRTRIISSALFSSLQPNLLLVTHPIPRGESSDLDLRPLKGLYSVWDIYKPECPTYILEGTGNPTMACFSSTQPFVLVGGTSEGNIHLWDLRENSTLHKDKDSEDLKISKGIRKPTFSTHLSLASLNVGGALDEESFISNYGQVVQIESIGFNSSNHASSMLSSSQFVTLDEFGTVLFWVTSEEVELSSRFEENLKRSPWGKMTLLPTKSFSPQSLQQLKQLSGNSLNQKLSNHRFYNSVPQVNVLGVISDDSSSFLLSDNLGHFHRISRTGQVCSPNSFNRKVEILKSSGEGELIASYDKVTVISTRPTLWSTPKDEVDNGSLVLVGRENGTLDLFQLQEPFPIHTWSLTTLSAAQRLKVANDKISNEIVCIKWLQYARSAFMVIDSCGIFYYFDLLHDFYHPIFVESIGLKSSDRINKNELDVSRLNSTLDSYRIALIQGGADNSYELSVRLINSAIMTSQKYTEEDEQRLQSKLRSVATSTHNACINF